MSLAGWLQGGEGFRLSWVDLGLGALVALLAYALMSSGLRFARTRLQALATHSATSIDDVLSEALAGTSRPLLLLAALLIGLGVMELPARWNDRVSQLWFVVLALQIGLWAHRAVRAGLSAYQKRHVEQLGPQASAAGTLIGWAATVLVWTVVLLSVLANLGVNITALVASLGIGGVAVALAVQNVLGDLFASVAIAVDKPFEVGDFIAVGAVSGTVERIGLKTTRIRSLGGEQIVMGNTDLLKQTINNFKRQQHRRVVFGFGLSYDTRAEQAEQIPALVRQVVERSPRLRFERAHLKAFGADSLDYEIVYTVQDPDFTLYMDEQQRINIALLREFRDIGVEFAFPTRALQFPARPLALRLESPDAGPAA